MIQDRCSTSIRHPAEEALKEIIRKKQKGEKIERPTEPMRGNVVNLMDALRRGRPASGKEGQEANCGAARNAIPHHRQEGQGNCEARCPIQQPTEEGWLEQLLGRRSA